MKSTKKPASSLLSHAALLLCALSGAGAAHAAAGPAAPSVQVCSWDKPGRDPFVGDVVAAVDRYQDIPAAVRARLKQRMAERSYDEFVAIERDAIVGKQAYAPEIRDMHFGDGRICKTVTRAKWTESMRERGMVYCEGDHCILVPTVCRNVSRITRLAQGRGAAHGGAGGADGARAHTLVVDSMDGLMDGLAEGAADPLGADAALVDGGAQGSVGQGATTFGTVAGRDGAGGVAALLASGASASFMSQSQSQFGSPFAGSAGAYGGAGVTRPGGTELEWGTSPVPEAPAWMMMGVAGAVLVLAGRRRRPGRELI